MFKPPKLADKLLEIFCKPELLEEIQGDLQAHFQRTVERRGLRNAQFNYWFQLLHFIRPFAIKKLQFNGIPMLKNHIISSLRFFGKHKGFTLINIFGLTLGFSSFLLILFFVNHELSFDQFHQNKERVYRVNFAFQDNAGNVTTLVNSPPALAYGIQGEFSELEKISRLRYAMNSLFSNEDIQFYEDHGYYADSLFLEILQYEMSSGDPHTALDQPNSIVITEELALKYFNDPNPIGATLLFNNSIPLNVTGVLANIPANSHLDFNFLISFPTYTVPEGYSSDLTSMGWLGFLTYVELKPNTDSKRFEAGLTQYIRDLNPDNPNPILPILQNISDIYLGSANMTDDLASHIRSGNRFNVKSLLLVAILILVIAGFNFSNLSHALSINRNKSTGIRKVLGANRKSIAVQSLTESLMLTFFCLALSFSVILALFPLISRFMMWEIGLGVVEIGKVIPVLITAGILIGIISGLYPALKLAGTDVINSLKGKLRTERSPLQLKNVLLTLQFAISIGLICATIILTKQIDYLRNTETGYNTENVVLIQMLPENMSRFFEVYKDQLVQHSPVMEVSRSERVIGDPWPFSVIRNAGEDPDMNRRIFFNQADYDYFATMAVPLNSGRFFSKEYLNDPTKSIIINQQAVEDLGLKDPIGQQVHFFELDGPRTIVGVVNDFNYTSLHQAIGPAAIVLPFIDLEYMYVRFNPGNPRAQIALLEDTWQEVSEGTPLEWKFLDADLRRLYESEENFSMLIQAFSILAILLACLGLYGMVTFMVNNRVKEIGVRKVLGASLTSLYSLFMKTYLYQTFLAMILTLPLVHYLLNGWLENFAYHIQIGWWIYPIATLLLIVLILITVSFQIMKAAQANPTRLLRHE